MALLHRFKLAALALPAVLLFGCGAVEKTFRVTSYPSQATIYLDGNKRGQTDMEKLRVTFPGSGQVILRLEKDGYQPTGSVLKEESNEVQFFALQESPNNQAIIKSLTNIQRLLERALEQNRGGQDKGGDK